MNMRLLLSANLGAALLALACAHAALASSDPRSGDQQACRMAADDDRWLRQALANWNIARRHLLKTAARPFEPIITYDSRCTHTVAGGAELRPRWTAVPHDGQVELPNGVRMPAGPNASNTARDGRNFVVFSLPSVWRPVAPKSEIPLEIFLEAILLHELAHAYQAVVSPSLSFPALHAKHLLPGSINDDSVQEKFKGNPAYVRDYEAERGLLFRAASATGPGPARALACEAHKKMRQRRARYFHGADAIWSEVDELSLTTEGLGEWVGYRWLTRVRKLPASKVLPKFRGRFWSQEHGLALFLVVERLVPDWQRLLLNSKPVTAEPLLARACGKRP